MKCGFSILFLLFLQPCFAQDSGPETIKDALREYGQLQSELNRLLDLKRPECSAALAPNGPATFCSVKDFCEKKDIQKDSPVLYTNDKGEQVLNERYYNLRAEIRSCLREKYSDEINARKEELIQQKKSQHLQRMLDANKKLAAAMKKYSQGNAVARVSSEILNMSIEAGLNGEDSGWEAKGTSKEQLTDMLSKAEKKLQIKLVPEIKNQLAEIQYLKNNQLYAEEAEAFEREVIPPIAPADPFYDWRKLTDAKAAGSERALAMNRKKLEDKTQSAYEVFKETREDLIKYLDSQKNRTNAPMIERAKEKIRTISFNPPRLTETLKKQCESPNAFYSSVDHSFTLCPQILNFPKMSMIETIAHEMAHSIDSCNFSRKLVNAKGPAVVEDAPFEIALKMDDESKKMKSYTANEDSGRASVVQPPMKYKDHPFSKTISCLQDPRSVGAVALNKDQIKKEVEKELESYQKNYGANATNNVDARYLAHLKDHFDEYFDYMEGCGFDGSGKKGLYYSQLQESFADKMAVEVVAAKMAAVSKEEAEKKMLEITVGYGQICKKESNDETKIIEFAEKMGCSDFYKNRDFTTKILRGLSLIDLPFDTHSEAVVRLDRNFLAHPSIRKALRCPADKGVKYCE